MKPGGVVSLKKVNFFHLITKNRLMILMLVLFILGFMVSSITFSNSKAALFSGKLYEIYISDRVNQGFFQVLFSVLFKYVAVCLLLFIFGASIAGVVFAPVLCCSLGLFYGLIASYTYTEFTLKGIAFNAIILMPAALMFILCILLSAKAAFSFSAIILKLTLPKSRPFNISAEFKIYCGKAILFVLLSFIAAITDSAVSVSFLKYFL